MVILVGLFLKFLERKNGLGNDEKIKLTAGQARKTRCYHPQAPLGWSKCRKSLKKE